MLLELKKECQEVISTLTSGTEKKFDTVSIVLLISTNGSLCTHTIGAMNYNRCSSVVASFAERYRRT